MQYKFENVELEDSRVYFKKHNVYIRRYYPEGNSVNIFIALYDSESL